VALAVDGAAGVLLVVYGLVSLVVLPLVLPRALGSLDDVVITYDRATLLPPSRLTVWGLHIEAPGRFGTWQMDAERARASVDLLALSGRTFEAQGLSGRGVELVHEPWPDGRERPPAEDPWTIRLVDFAVDDLDVFGVQRVRLRGPAALTGTLRVADRTTFDGAVECVDCELHRIDGAPLATLSGAVALSGVEGARGDPLSLDVLRHTHGHAEVSGHFPDLEALRIQASLAPWAQIVGEASGSLVLDIVDGGLAPGSTVTLRGQPLGIRLRHYVASGEASVALTIDDVARSPRTRIDGTFESFALYDEAIEVEGQLGERLAEGAALTFQVRTPSASLYEIHSPIDGHLRVPDATIPDLSMLRRWVPRGVGLTVNRGEATIRGFFEATVGEDPSATANLELDASDVGLTWDDDEILTDAHVDVQIEDGDVTTGTFDVSGTRIRLDRLAMEDIVEERRWWADVAFLDGEIDVDDGFALDARLAFSILDSSPIVGLVGDSMAGWTRSLLTRPDVKGRGRFRIAPGQYEVDELHIEDGRNAAVRMHLRRGEDRPREGAVFAKLGLLSVGVGIHEDERDFHLFNAEDWYEASAEAF